MKRTETMFAGIAIFASVLFSAAGVCAAGESDAMKAFAPAAAGMQRFVIRLPAQPDESALKVELIVGKTVRVDAGNRYFFGGVIETETVAGWGYPQYLLRKLGPLAGTLMAVDPAQPKVDRFVTVGGESLLLRYNSRLPIVVYVPAEVKVRYRLWRAQDGFVSAHPG
ncbi:MAG: ecotin family protein [Burkholderiaceae bacterium]|nr:ecotin family protein [Burkholderiaceae bacterium]